MDYAFREFEKVGYAVNSTSTVVRDPAQVKFLYREGLFSGADLLSVGVASFGHINGVHYQNQADFDPYLAKVQAGSCRFSGRIRRSRTSGISGSSC